MGACTAPGPWGPWLPRPRLRQAKLELELGGAPGFPPRPAWQMQCTRLQVAGCIGGGWQGGGLQSGAAYRCDACSLSADCTPECACGVAKWAAACCWSACSPCIITFALLTQLAVRQSPRGNLKCTHVQEWWTGHPGRWTAPCCWSAFTPRSCPGSLNAHMRTQGWWTGRPGRWAEAAKAPSHHAVAQAISINRTLTLSLTLTCARRGGGPRVGRGGRPASQPAHHAAPRGARRGEGRGHAARQGGAEQGACPHTCVRGGGMEGPACMQGSDEQQGSYTCPVMHRTWL